MEGYSLAAVAGVVVLVAVVIIFVINAGRAQRSARVENSRALGFTPLTPSPELTAKLAALHARPGTEAGDYRLENVSSRRLPDGDLILFDLIDASSSDSSTSEIQAVATISPSLDLPVFALFPRTEGEGMLADAANQVMGWLLARLGDPIEFPEVPAFGRRYFVSSRDPDGTRRFLDESRLRRLADTRLLAIRAGGDAFTLLRVDQLAARQDPQSVSDRINQARFVHTVFMR